jgi:hypothetical protein
MVAISRTVCVFLFLILLTIQLTGLSCLDEWTLTPQTTVSQGSSGLDDDCPCHFTFVSSPSTKVHRSSLVNRVVVRPPTTYAFDAQFLLFRPPASA